MGHQKISILIPVYGVEKYISKCLESVANQTYKNIEVIFINDCTKDDSINIVEQYIDGKNKNFDKITIINNSVNVGLAATRNNGLKHATGDFIIHLDSDDYLELDAIENLVSLQNKEDADIVIGNYNVISNNQTILREFNIIRNKSEYLVEVIFRRTYLNVWGNLYKKHLFDNIKFVNGANFGEDYTIMPKLIYTANNISFLDTAVCNYRLLTEGSYTQNIKQKSIEDILIGYKSLVCFFNETNNKNYIEMINKSFYTLKAQMIKTTKGDKELLNYFKQEIKLYPKKYPNTNTKINNCINYMFDFNITLCSLIIRKISKYYVKKY